MPPRKSSVVGHGELLKALNELPRVTDQRFRIAAMHLAHAQPPTLVVYVKTETIATLVGCTSRSVELCRTWLTKIGAATVLIGGGRRQGGRGVLTTVDFNPLADRVIAEAGFGVCTSETPNEKADTPKAGADTPKAGAAVYEKDPLEGPLLKDGAIARASERARVAPDPEIKQAGLRALREIRDRLLQENEQEARTKPVRRRAAS